MPCWWPPARAHSTRGFAQRIPQHAVGPGSRATTPLGSPKPLGTPGDPPGPPGTCARRLRCLLLPGSGAAAAREGGRKTPERQANGQGEGKGNYFPKNTEESGGGEGAPRRRSGDAAERCPGGKGRRRRMASSRGGHREPSGGTCCHTAILREQRQVLKADGASFTPNLPNSPRRLLGAASHASLPPW